ncbi:(4Fe-4S)-binding protein [Propionibacteriaceae bacterium G1746]|uniref:(4Fe-4S)-binding protein n=1 Tax=Aestuariimicrobium sp. G57 TaxID=3418485 RepID=UPI003C17DF36
MSDNEVTEATASNHEFLIAETANQAGDAIIAIDREGIIRVWNAKCEQTFGWSADEALGQPVEMIIPEKYRAGHEHGFGNAMASGHLASDGKARLTRALSKSGEPTYVEMTFAVVNDASGAAVGAVAVARAAEKPDRGGAQGAQQQADPRDEKGPRKLYTGPLVDVSFEAELCIHSGNCTGGMPSVFNTRKRPWIDPGVADTPEKADELRAVIRRCPSGALQIVEHEQGE